MESVLSEPQKNKKGVFFLKYQQISMTKQLKKNA